MIALSRRRALLRRSSFEVHMSANMKTVTFVSCLLPLFVSSIVAQPQVVIRAQRDSDGVTYRYFVENTARKPIVRIMIGRDSTTGRSFLRALPDGWTQDGVPPGAALLPTGWSVDGIVEEDDRTFCVEFFPTAEGDPTHHIKSTEQRQFAIRVETTDDNYLRGPATVIFSDGSAIVTLLSP